MLAKYVSNRYRTGRYIRAAWLPFAVTAAFFISLCYHKCTTSVHRSTTLKYMVEGRDFHMIDNSVMLFPQSFCHLVHVSHLCIWPLGQR